MRFELATRKLLSLYVVVTLLGRCAGFVPATSWQLIPHPARHSVAQWMKRDHFGFRYLEDPFWFSVLSTTLRSDVDVIGSVNGRKLLTMSVLSEALEIWERHLSEGLIPSSPHWPKEPLLNKISKALLEMQIPMLTMRHPQLLPSVLRALLQLATEYNEKLKYMREDWKSEEEEEEEEEESEGGGSEHDVLKCFNEDKYVDCRDQRGSRKDDATSYEETEEMIAELVAKQFERQWRPAIQALDVLDDMYGASHGLLDFQNDDYRAGGQGGFGLFDGIWRHSGWTEIRELSQQIKQMPELRDLMKKLGKRPTVTEATSCVKAPPQRKGQYAGVALSAHLPHQMDAIKQSSSIEGALPSDIILLRKQKLLLLSKLAEEKVNSYEMVGYENSLSKPIRRPWRCLKKQPVKSGGPLIICLDTSWSMSGSREKLSKAVVVECASFAARESRPMYVLAFSGYNDLEECKVDLTVSKLGIKNLLEFLSKGFKGGTDITRPLERAIDLIDGVDEYASSDVLLVTDGELQTPPVSLPLFKKIGNLEEQKCLEIHGLIIGKTASVPLNMLCTDWDGADRVHTFLNKYDLVNTLRADDERNIASFDGVGGDGSVATFPSSSKSKFRPRTSTRLSAAAVDAPLGASMTEVKLKPGSERMIIRKEKLRSLIQNINRGLIEREEESRLVLLCVLCEEHLMLLGPPGTGKSELGRRVASATEGNLFERLLTKYTTPDELFGPLSLAQLERDKYVRKIDRYLPTAKVAFLDEVFKANSAILNALLTILNERKFDNGVERIDIPLLSVVGASNELPDSEELEALYDRFLFRKQVTSVSDKSIFDLLNLRGDDVVTKMDKAYFVEDMLDAIREEERLVIIPQNILNLLRSIRTYLRDEADPPNPISDRRLLKIARMLRISAITNGRTIVGVQDCLLLKHVVWYEPGEQIGVVNWLWEHLVPPCDEKGFEFLVKSLKDRMQTQQSSDDRDDGRADRHLIVTEMTTLRGIFENKLEEYRMIQRDLTSKDSNIWISPADEMLLQQKLGPQVDKRINLMTNLWNVVKSFQDIFGDVLPENSEHATPGLLDEKWEEYKKNSQKLKGTDMFDSDDVFENDDFSASLEGQMVETAFGIASGDMSTKEAKSKLTPEAYKAWKKANKARNKRKVKRDALDDDY